MFLEVAAATGSAWALRRIAHHAILRGLRAPRLAHAQGPDEHGFAADQVREVRIPGPRAGTCSAGWCCHRAKRSGPRRLCW